MDILLCIDDTDDIESEGTGELAQIISKEIETKGWGRCFGITRHQLLIHEDIPYTSHNSSMCFRAEIDETYLDSIIDYASDFLKRRCAKGSDPGLCIVEIDNLKNSKKLMDFGLKAKKTVLTKYNAYELAKELGIHLSEHGGTGLGIIGALAGTGLRLTGNDGRFKGKHNLGELQSEIKIKEACKHPSIDRVRSIDGTKLNEEETILLGDKVKTVLIDDEAVLLVYKKNDKDSYWCTCTKQQLRNY